MGDAPEQAAEAAATHGKKSPVKSPGWATIMQREVVTGWTSVIACEPGDGPAYGILQS